MSLSFKARIYKTGINWAVDVPEKVSAKLKKTKGYIRIKGKINGFDFKTNLVPVKDSPHRLFVNGIMMKGGNTALDKVASFEIEQNTTKVEEEYPVPSPLKKALKEHKVEKDFKALTPTRVKDILRYLYYIKTEETLQKNIAKVIKQLKDKSKNTRIP
ncbi:MAG: YdeI/OmpD-associated family protein [Bacteroidia bacterium]|nr:YdeI/OmpD-associated family protein [Bacteroidia bacterium]